MRSRSEQRTGSPSRVELLRRAAEAANLSGDADRAVLLGRSALGSGRRDADPRTAAALHERIGRYLWVCGLQRDALAELSRAVAVMPDDAPPAERARVLGAEGHLLMLLGRGAEARARCELALELAREAGARLEECRVPNSLGARADDDRRARGGGAGRSSAHAGLPRSSATPRS